MLQLLLCLQPYWAWGSQQYPHFVSPILGEASTSGEGLPAPKSPETGDLRGPVGKKCQEKDLSGSSTKSEYDLCWLNPTFMPEQTRKYFLI